MTKVKVFEKQPWSQIASKVKVFQNYIKLQGQGHEVKNYDTTWKVLSQWKTHV